VGAGAIDGVKVSRAMVPDGILDISIFFNTVLRSNTGLRERTMQMMQPAAHQAANGVVEQLTMCMQPAAHQAANGIQMGLA
jgi:hypothetical protein